MIVVTYFDVGYDSNITLLLYMQYIRNRNTIVDI